MDLHWWPSYLLQLTICKYISLLFFVNFYIPYLFYSDISIFPSFLLLQFPIFCISIFSYFLILMFLGSLRFNLCISFCLILTFLVSYFFSIPCFIILTSSVCCIHRWWSYLLQSTVCNSLPKFLITFNFNQIIFSAWAALCNSPFKVRRALLWMHFQRQKLKMFNPKRKRAHFAHPYLHSWTDGCIYT